MRVFVVLSLLLLSVVPSVQASVLWEQLPLVGEAAHADQQFLDFPAYSTFQVNDVSVGAGGWVVTKVTSYFTHGYGSWPALAPVRLNVFAKTGSLPQPSNNPLLGFLGLAAINRSDPTMNLVTLSGLNMPLLPGDYWIGLTPILPFSGGIGQEYHLVSNSVIGDYTAIRNPGGAFGFGTAWTTYGSLPNSPELDGAIKIEGCSGGGPVVPEPSALALLSVGLGGMAGFIRRRG